MIGIMYVVNYMNNELQFICFNYKIFEQNMFEVKIISRIWKLEILEKIKLQNIKKLIHIMFKNVYFTCFRVLTCYLPIN